MAETTQILLERFKSKKAEKDSTSLQEARRLVNLYRSLSCFGNDFVDKYNQMLLTSKPNVRRLLSTFMGGKEVEDYLEFLEQNTHVSVSGKGENKSSTELPQNKGYLPDPDFDLGTKKEQGMISVSEKEWNEMQAQKDALVKQTQELLSALKKLEGNKFSSPQATAPNLSATKSPSFENYSEILEDTGGDKINE